MWFRLACLSFCPESFLGTKVCSLLQILMISMYQILIMKYHTSMIGTSTFSFILTSPLHFGFWFLFWLFGLKKQSCWMHLCSCKRCSSSWKTHLSVWQILFIFNTSFNFQLICLQKYIFWWVPWIPWIHHAHVQLLLPFLPKKWHFLHFIDIISLCVYLNCRTVNFLVVDTMSYSFFSLKINLFIFGCFGSSLLHTGFLWLRRAGVTLRCSVGFSLRWLLLLWSTGSRCTGFSSCSTRAQ